MGRATRWFKGLFGIKNENSSVSGHRKDKKSSSFGHSDRDSNGFRPNFGNSPANAPATPTEASWLGSYYAESEKEQNKHAIAVAAATAAAADAAVAAAQAAVAVVRLTSHGRGTMFGGGRERWAAAKIQAVFRGYLARKALRALKGLVKLQALVRGYLVRKQAAATFYSMQALIRAQATVRGLKFQSRNSIDARNENMSSVHHSRRVSVSALSASIENSITESPKIVEIDTGRPKSVSRSRRPHEGFPVDSGEDPRCQTLSTAFPSQIPARLYIPDSRNYYDAADWGLMGDEYRFSTAQSTPRFVNSGGAATPAKSVCADNFLRHYMNYPNYMTNTQSFNAKLRSQSAPRQRPDGVVGSKKKLSLNEMMESRSSLSGVRMQKSCSEAQEVINFKNVVMGKLDRSTEFSKETEKYYAQQR